MTNRIAFLIISLLVFTVTHTFSQKPIERKGGPYVKTSLNAYSFSKLLNDYNRTNNRDSGLSMFDLLDFSAKQNFDAVDLTGYFFPGYPAVPGDSFINAVKRKAHVLGLDISGTGVRNDFASPDPEKRAADVKHVKEWIDVAVKLGAPVIRVFAGPIPPGYEKKWDSIAVYMTACLKECVAYGKSRGVIVGVQNHGDFLKTAEDCIKLVKMVDSDWFGIIVDTGYFISDDPYVDIQKVMPYAVNFQVKESPFGVLSRVRIDLKRLMKIVYDSGYRGYLPIETLADKVKKGEPKPATPFRPYDPYKLVPAFFREVKAAIKAQYHTNDTYVKASLNAYSFSKALNDKIKGRGEGMSLFQLLDFAATNNFDAIDLTGYFFPGYPAVPDDAFINDIKRRAHVLGLDISGTGVRNDFANPDPAKRAADVKHVKEWIDVAVKLGAPVIRIFSGNIPPGYENKWDSIAVYMAAAIKECADYGKSKGVLVGVQNHGDFLKTADQTIRLVKMVGSEWFGIIVDTGYFITTDPYVDIEKVMPWAVNFQLKESVFGAASTIRTDVPRTMKIVKKSGYRGYLPIETLSAAGGNKNKKRQGPRYHRQAL